MYKQWQEQQVKSHGHTNSITKSKKNNAATERMDSKRKQKLWKPDFLTFQGKYMHKNHTLNCHSDFKHSAKTFWLTRHIIKIRDSWGQLFF